MGFPGGSVVKNPSPGVGATWDAVQFLSLGQEHPPEEKMATYSSILAWEIPWTEEPGRFQSMGSQKSQAGLSDWACTHTSSKVYVLDPVADSSTFMPAQTISLSHPQGFHSQCQQWVYLGHATKFLLMRNQFPDKRICTHTKKPQVPAPHLNIWQSENDPGDNCNLLVTSLRKQLTARMAWRQKELGPLLPSLGCWINESWNPL